MNTGIADHRGRPWRHGTQQPPGAAGGGDRQLRTPYVLYREPAFDDDQPEEIAAIQASFPDAHGQRVDRVGRGRVVFPRFAQLPFGEYLEAEIEAQGSVMVNSWPQVRYVADLFAWAGDLAGLTPAAHRVDELADLPEGEYFVKGTTNSLKRDWLTSAYAPTRAAIPGVLSNLRADPVTAGQDLVIRPFVHYRRLATVPATGQPVVNEWRVFVLHGTVMAKGFYWNSQRHLLAPGAGTPLDPTRFEETLSAAVRVIAPHTNFVVIDLAERPDGSWDVIELNDANMAGLSAVSANELWANIAAHFRAAG